MLADLIARSNDPEQLRQIAKLLLAENAVLYQRVADLRTALARARGEERTQLELELKLIQEQLERREAALFGTKSERRRRPEGEAPPKPAPERKGHGPKRQPKLPVVEVQHHLDEADTTCPSCGDTLRAMNGQFEESEEIDVVTQSYRILLHRRQKCRCGRCGHIDTALGPDKLIEGGRYTVEFAAQVAADKFGDHLPLERQAARMARADLDVSSTTLWDQTEALAHHLWPSYMAVRDEIIVSSVIGADETSWRVMRKGGSKRWWVWSICTELAVHHVILPGRGKDSATVALQGYAGIVVADGYAAYDSLAADKSAAATQPELGSDGAAPPPPSFRLACCWSHARRGFFQAEPHYPEASGALEIIDGLFAVERRADDVPDGVTALEHRRHLRRTESADLLVELKAWMDRQRPLPSSKVGKAIQYVRDRWDELTLFLDHPEVPIDNNQTERLLRGVVLGRKNHQGSRSERGTRVAACLYSLVETAKLEGLNPAAYLAEAARRAIRSPGTVLTPRQWRLEIEAVAGKT
jgi:transposase